MYVCLRVLAYARPGRMRTRTHLEIRVPIGYQWAPLGYIAWYLGYFIRPRVLRDEKGTSRQQRVQKMLSLTASLKRSYTTQIQVTYTF